MSRRKTDFRALKARRDAAMTRPELRGEPKHAVDEAAIAEAIKAGRYTKIPAKKRGALWKPGKNRGGD